MTVFVKIHSWQIPEIFKNQSIFAKKVSIKKYIALRFFQFNFKSNNHLAMVCLLNDYRSWCKYDRNADPHACLTSYVSFNFACEQWFSIAWVLLRYLAFMILLRQVASILVRLREELLIVLPVQGILLFFQKHFLSGNENYADNTNNFRLKLEKKCC